MGTKRVPKSLGKRRVVPKKDTRIERMLADPDAYFAAAREKALRDADEIITQRTLRKSAT